MKNVPELRFKGLESNYEIKKISSLLERVSNSVDVNPIEFYRQIGIRSHGKGIFYKDAVSGESLGNKRVFWVEPNVFILNIVFAWERAVAKTTDAEIGMIASHRFPMYKPKSGVFDLDYITLFFKFQLLLHFFCFLYIINKDFNYGEIWGDIYGALEC